MEKIKSKQKTQPGVKDKPASAAEQKQVTLGNTSTSIFCFHYSKSKPVKVSYPSALYFKSALWEKMYQSFNDQTACSLSTDNDEKAKRDAGKWWKPWVSQPGGEQRLHARTCGEDAEADSYFCVFLTSGEQLRLSSVREWQRGGRRGGHGEERRGRTHEEEVCFSGWWATAKEKVLVFSQVEIS